MAKKTKKKTKATPKFSGLGTLKQVWTARPARQWLELLNEIAPDHRWTLQGENTIKGCCPYHDDSTPSFFLSFNKKWGKCFGCNKFIVDLVSLVAKLQGSQSSYVEALLFIQNYFGLTEELGKHADELSAYYQTQEMKKETAIAMRKVVEKLVATDAPELQYLKPGLVHLTKARGLSIANLKELPVGLYAKPEHLKEFIPDQYKELFDEYWGKKELQTPDKWGAIAFHYNDSPGSISQFKLRKLDKLAVEKAQETDSTLEEITTEQAHALLSKENYIFVEDPFTDYKGVYGLHAYQHLLGRQTDPNAYVTEGEFDVLSVMNAQLTLGSFDFVILGTSGTGSLNVGFLKDFGVRTVWLVPDHPAKQGDAYASNFLAEKGNFAHVDSSVPFSIKVFRWPPMLVGFDLDEAIRSNDYHAIRQALFVDRNTTFMNSNVWISTMCDTAIEKVKKGRDQELQKLDMNDNSDSVAVEVENLKDNARQRIHALILDWFRLIHDPSERLAFSQKYMTQENIDITQDSRVHSAVYNLDDRDGVIHKLREAFKEYFEMAYYEKQGNKFVSCAWSKKHKHVVPFPTEVQTIGSHLSQEIGKEYTGWIEQLLKDSPFWNFTGENPMSDEKEKGTTAKNWLVTMMNSLRGECKNKYHLTKVGQGIHHFGLPGGARNKGYIYFVNGNQVFRGHISTDTDMIEWEDIENCVDEEIRFDLGHNKKWSFVNDVSDLYAASKIDLHSVYERVLKIVQGWTFEHNDLTCRYLAAQIMSLPISAAIGNVNIMFVTGESESGKTSLIRGLLGGTQTTGHDLTPILESSEAFMDLSAAAMYQKFDRGSLAMVYDEAEVSENHNTAHDKKTLDIQRMIMTVPQGGARIGRGGQTADQGVDYFFRMPIIMAGINLPADKVFLSRVLVMYTKKEYGHRSLADYISQHFKKHELEQLRNEITVGLIPHIPDLIRRRSEFKQRLNSQEVGKKVSDRFLDNVVTPLLIYDYVQAGSGVELFKEMFEANRDRLEGIHGVDTTSDLVNACLYKASVKISHQDGMTDFHSARHLIQNGETHVLNNAGCGVYYYPDKDWIILVWRQVKHSVLRDTPHYSRMSEEALRERVSKTDHAVPEVSQAEHEKIRRALNLMEIKSHAGYSVIRGSYLGMEDVNHEILEEEHNPVHEGEAVVNFYDHGTEEPPEEAPATEQDVASDNEANDDDSFGFEV